MNIDFAQISLLQHLADSQFNLSRAAAAMGLSQPSASRKLKELETSVGAALVVRNGRRITALTPLGARLVEPARDFHTALSHARALVDEHHGRGLRELTIATTHSQARYFLPTVITRFRRRFPDVRIQLSQSMPAQIARLVRDGAVELGICTDRIAQDPELHFVPGYRWSHAVCAPRGHPILTGTLALSDLAAHPVLTYVDTITGRGLLEAFLAERGVTLDVVLEAADTDVLKTFIRLGLGYGLIASMGFDPEADTDLVLRRIPGAPVLSMGVARRRGAFLSRPARALIDMVRDESERFETRIRM